MNRIVREQDTHRRSALGLVDRLRLGSPGRADSRVGWGLPDPSWAPSLLKAQGQENTFGVLGPLPFTRGLDAQSNFPPEDARWLPEHDNVHCDSDTESICILEIRPQN